MLDIGNAFNYRFILCKIYYLLIKISFNLSILKLSSSFSSLYVIKALFFEVDFITDYLYLKYVF